MDPLASRHASDQTIPTKQRSALAARERTGGNVHAAWLDAECDSRVDFVDFATRAPALTTALAGSQRTGHGWPVPDLTAFVAVAEAWVEAEDQLAEDEAGLRETYGARWPLVPQHQGPVAAQAKEILGTGLVPVLSTTADSASVLRALGPFVQFTSDTARHLLEQLSLLGESLGADLSGLPLGNLHHLTHAILRLADAPPPNPAWCRPATARAASVALAALGEDVSAAAALRQRLYEDFTEELWDLPSIREHASIDKWWKVASRRTVRAELASASRTGRPPADLKSHHGGHPARCRVARGDRRVVELAQRAPRMVRRCAHPGCRWRDEVIGGNARAADGHERSGQRNAACGSVPRRRVRDRRAEPPRRGDQRDDLRVGRIGSALSRARSRRPSRHRSWRSGRS